MQIAILSNGSPAMLEAVVKSSELEDLIQTILSVEMVGIFKPDPTVYQLAIDRLGVTATEIVFMSANAWDAAGATAFGLRVAWINRFVQRPERLPFEPDIEIKTSMGICIYIPPRIKGRLSLLNRGLDHKNIFSGSGDGVSVLDFLKSPNCTDYR